MSGSRQGGVTHWVLVFCLLCFGCYDSQDGRQAPKLSGIWGGYFPGSSLQHPENGVEIHFDRPEDPKQPGTLHAAGFIHRSGRQGSRHHLKVEQRDDRVTLTLGPGTADESVFTGTFVDDLRVVRGIFTNSSRGESFAMDLLNEQLVALAILRPVSNAPPQTSTSGNQVRAQANALTQSKAWNDHLALQLQFTNDVGSPHALWVGYGPWWYYPTDDLASWRGLEVCDDGTITNDRDCPRTGLGYYGTGFEGASSWKTMVFYPDWLLLELWPGSQSNLADQQASFEIHFFDLLKLDGSGLASESWFAERRCEDGGKNCTSQYPHVKDLTLSYARADVGWCCDIPSVAVQWDNPGYRNVVVGSQVYQVPSNTQKMLESLGFVLPYQK